MLGGGLGFGSGVDLAAVLAFVAFGVVAFLAPVVGYEDRRPAGLGAALYLLVAYVVVSVPLLGYQWVQVMDGNGGGNGGPLAPNGRAELVPHVLIAGALVTLVLFAAAMLSFTVGVWSLKRRRTSEPADRTKSEGW